jgi:hypothetical protein
LTLSGRPNPEANVESLDLLNERIVVKCTMQRGKKKNKRIDASSAYSEIEKAFESQRSAIEEAIRLLV